MENNRNMQKYLSRDILGIIDQYRNPSKEHWRLAFNKTVECLSLEVPYVKVDHFVDNYDFDVVRKMVEYMEVIMGYREVPLCEHCGETKSKYQLCFCESVRVLDEFLCSP